MSDSFSDGQLMLSAIVSSSDDAIIGKDVDGTITSWNRAAERIFGYTEDEAIGQSIRLIIPTSRYAEEDDVLRRVCAGEGGDHYETVRRARDNRLVQVSLTVSPIKTPDGAIIGVSDIARDVTMTKRLERDARHFASIVASSEDAIISKDLQGTVLSWNQAAERMFGYSATDIVGRSIRLIVPSDRQAEEDHVLAAVGRGETVDHFETVRQRKDGTLVPISLTISPIRDNAGTVVGASKIARDLTRTERIQRDALRLAAIVESSDDAIVGKDLNGIVTSWNAAAERMFGYSSAEMIGRSIRVIIPGDRQHEEDEVLSRIRLGQGVDHRETVRLGKDGTLVPVSLTVSPIRNERGVVVGASKIVRNISERVRADEDRKRLLDMARSASQLKDEFLATLSHELRTPLSAIVGYIRLMQSGLLPAEKQTQAIDTVCRNATSLTQIVEDVLDVSRIISGKLRLNVQPVELSDIVRQAVETMQPAADAKGIRVDVIVDPVATQVSGDPDRLRQVLWNLCSNAVKFTERGGRVQVRLERVNSHVEVTVADTGIGIPPEFLPRLFDRFSQADAGIDRLHRGLGLGLAISRHLVELQGGQISAHSPGLHQGSSFCVELPLRSIDAPIAGKEIRQHPSTPSDRATLEIPHLNGVRILVVDDDRDALALAREILENTGATVTTAESGQDALDTLQRGGTNVLIADLGMPGMTGFELIERIRRSDDVEMRAIPSAALTAFARSEDRARALRVGFEMHLSKPIEPGELMAAAAALARRRTLR